MTFPDPEECGSEVGDLDAKQGLSRKVSLTLGGFFPSSTDSQSDPLRTRSNLLRF